MTYFLLQCHLGKARCGFISFFSFLAVLFNDPLVLCISASEDRNQAGINYFLAAFYDPPFFRTHCVPLKNTPLYHNYCFFVLFVYLPFMHCCFSEERSHAAINFTSFVFF